MDTEHGIVFNKPYTTRDTNIQKTIELGSFLPTVGKTSYKNQSQNYGGTGSSDNQLLLIPIAVISDRVFCFALINRHTVGQTEWEPSQMQYSPPMAYYMVDDEHMCYFSNPPIKEFVEKWKLVD